MTASNAFAHRVARRAPVHRAPDLDDASSRFYVLASSYRARLARSRSLSGRNSDAGATGGAFRFISAFSGCPVYKVAVGAGVLHTLVVSLPPVLFLFFLRFSASFFFTTFLFILLLLQLFSRFIMAIFYSFFLLFVAASTVVAAPAADIVLERRATDRVCGASFSQKGTYDKCVMDTVFQRTNSTLVSKKSFVNQKVCSPCLDPVPSLTSIRNASSPRASSAVRCLPPS